MEKEKSKDSITVNADTKITALWKVKATYTITVNNPQEGGKISASPTSAKAGDPVTITAKPSEGFVLNTLTVTDEAGNPVQVTNNSFTMPAGGVTVSATFKKSEPQGPQDGEKEIKPGEAAQITNKQTGLDLKIIKRDNNDRRLKDAKFELERYTDGTYKTKDDTFKKFTVYQMPMVMLS